MGKSYSKTEDKDETISQNASEGSNTEVSSQEILIESAALAEEEKDVEDSDLGQPSISQTPKPLTSRRHPATDIAERLMTEN
ncbi:unnamed protein product [Arctia plantaginis]|uniref:Uncharacterized protein n=1 Tax=Arctia plantaginis TaxID=874455 RepID=A0A8S1ATP8_ARCPL|nr:unnamed protein product [Arctia plantaginis]